MNVYIFYGVFEGSWHGKKLRKLLVSEGFKISKDFGAAEIIIAHSGGCYLIPEDTNAKVVVLIGLPYWPGKKISTSLKQKVKIETKNLRWIKKSFYNSIYLVSKPGKWLKMNMAMKKLALPEYRWIPIVAVRNKHDTFTHPDLIEDIANKKGWTTKRFDGHHDDLWTNPEPYIKLIKESIKS